MGAKIVKNYELRITNDEVVARWAIKRGDSKNSILRGRLQNTPTQRTLKMIDYQVYRIFQSFLPVRLAPLTKFFAYAARSSHLWQSIGIKKLPAGMGQFCMRL